MRSGAAGALCCSAVNMKVSLPALPNSVSLPIPPLRTLAALLPTMTLLSPLPVPLIAGRALQEQVLDRCVRGKRSGDGGGDRVNAAAVVHRVRAVVQNISIIA